MKWFKCLIEESSWKKFSKEMPEEGDMILVCSRDEMNLGEFRKAAAGPKFFLRIKYRKDNCTCQWHFKDKWLHEDGYWMPLPEKPHEMD